MAISLSIILPAYNTADYITACVDSCEHQDIDKSRFELIIVNDGSTDSTGEKIEQLCQKYDNIVVITQENQGLSMARNNGFDISRGKYVWFVDSDDTIAQNCLGSILTVMDEFNLDMFGVGPSIPLCPIFPKNFSSKTDITCVYTGREWILSDKTFIGAWAYVIRTDFWRENRLRFYPNICFEDTELMPKAWFKASRIASLDTFSCYNYIQRPGSIMHSGMSEKKIFDMAKIINSHQAFIETLDSGEDNQAVIDYFEKSKSGQFIAAVKNIAKKRDQQLLTRWMAQVNKMPTFVYGSSLPQRLYQSMILRFPGMYCTLRRFF